MPRTLSQPELEPDQQRIRVEYLENETTTPNNPQAMSPSALKPPKLEFAAGYSISSSELPDIFQKPYTTHFKGKGREIEKRDLRSAERISYAGSEREYTNRPLGSAKDEQEPSTHGYATSKAMTPTQQLYGDEQFYTQA